MVTLIAKYGLSISVIFTVWENFFRVAKIHVTPSMEIRSTLQKKSILFFKNLAMNITLKQNKIQLLSCFFFDFVYKQTVVNFQKIIYFQIFKSTHFQIVSYEFAK